MIDRPNFFIVGAPKCGTTALADYLRAHPAVVMSWPKEPHFFSTDLPGLSATASLEEYLAMFPEITSQTKAVGEASVNYLSSRTAMRNIHEFDPLAKIIVMVRNPLTWLISYHSQLVRVREEDAVLEEALQLQQPRQLGEQLPRHNRAAEILQYLEMGRFGAQIGRLLEIFPREQVKIIVFEDFRKDTKGVYEDLLAFLGVETDNRTEFPVINPARQNRFRWLATFTEKTPQPLIRFALKLKSLLGIRRWGILDNLRRANREDRPNQPLSPQLRAELIAQFESDVRRLSEILARDLATEWLGEA